VIIQKGCVRRLEPGNLVVDQGDRERRDRIVDSARRSACHVPRAGTADPLPKMLTFKDEGKIRELARRGEAWQTSEDRQLLDYAIAKGEGGVYLRLSPEQYARLRRP
jgi:hypothetical protein